jgi:hypothetical protein
MRPFPAILLALLAGLSAPIMLSACHDDTETPRPDGSVDLRIDVAGHSISTLTYTIFRPGESAITGEIDVSDPADTSHRIGAIPVGEGYTLRLEGQSTTLVLTCQGDSASFDVAAGLDTLVEITISCWEADDTGTDTDTTSTSSTDTTSTDTSDAEGGIDVEVGVNLCPKITVFTATPGSAPVGESIILDAGASDADDVSLTYSWLSDGDPLPGESTVAYFCASAGAHAITLAVSDGECSDTQTVVVDCTG